MTWQHLALDMLCSLARTVISVEVSSALSGGKSAMALRAKSKLKADQGQTWPAVLRVALAWEDVGQAQFGIGPTFGLRKG